MLYTFNSKLTKWWSYLEENQPRNQKRVQTYVRKWKWANTQHQNENQQQQTKPKKALHKICKLQIENNDIPQLINTTIQICTSYIMNNHINSEGREGDNYANHVLHVRKSEFHSLIFLWNFVILIAHIPNQV